MDRFTRWKKKNPVKWSKIQADGHRRRKYGITAEQFETLQQVQNGKCAICKTREASHVDHDHSTGRVRGLLCIKCNTGLGMFQDQAEMLDKAKAYLTMYGT